MKVPHRKRIRYCDIRATNLEEILKVCERHLTNISLTESDLIENGDGTGTDKFYIDMFRNTWADLRDDVKAIMEQADEAQNTSYEHLVACLRSGQMSVFEFRQHLEENPHFAAWYEKQVSKDGDKDCPRR